MISQLLSEFIFWFYKFQLATLNHVPWKLWAACKKAISKTTPSAIRMFYLYMTTCKEYPKVMSIFFLLRCCDIPILAQQNHRRDTALPARFSFHFLFPFRIVNFFQVQVAKKNPCYFLLCFSRTRAVALTTCSAFQPIFHFRPSCVLACQDVWS